jgi:aerobic carbon-monoxide dehydrogenase large subunit
MERLVGSRVQRLEDPRLLTGRGRYISDVRLPRMLHAAFCRSPFPHARIRGVDTSAAAALPGVVAVLTAADLDGVAYPMTQPAPEGLTSPGYPALARDKARMVGDPVALVLATSRAVAEDACELVEVDWDELGGIGSIDAALAPGAPLVWDEAPGNVAHTSSHVHGDPDAAFARATRVVSARFTQHRQTHVPLEGRGAVMTWDGATRSLTVQSAVQGPHMVRIALAGLLGLPATHVRVTNADIGGSFGQKTAVRPEDLALAVAAMRVDGTPVSWIEDRAENLAVAGQARDERLDVEAAIDDDGHILGLRVGLVLDEGAYPLVNLPATVFTTIMRVLLPGAYRLDHFAFDTTITFSNKATYAAYRGPWEVETWVRERLLDLVAREVGIDPVEVRRRNLLRDDELPRPMVTGPTLSNIRLREAIDEAEHHAGWAAFRVEQAAARAEGRHLGLGVATFIEPAPGPPDYGPAIGFAVPPERATIRMEADGSITLLTSQAPHGQGHVTTLSQLVADELGLPIDAVSVVHGDSATSPFTMMGTGGSRAATMASGSALGAADGMRDRIAAITAHVLEAAPDDIELVDGVARVRGTPAAAIPFAQIAQLAHFAPSMLPAGMAQGMEVTFDHTAGEGGWTQSVHSCFVEVDVETGLVRILRYVVVEDCGAVINPGIVEGQICGGVVMGMGSVLWERSQYDDDGTFRSGTFAEYLLASSGEVPPIEIHHLHSDAASRDFRGVGEGGAIGAPAAVTSAIEDALAPFGVRITDQHLPPAKLLELLGVIATG